jgi:hypothetical protein
MMGDLLLQIIVPTALGVIGLINLFIGFRKGSNVDGQSAESLWYKQPYVLLGISSILIAVVLLLNDIRIDIIPASNKTMQFLFFVIEGIVLVGSGICLFSLRHFFLSSRQRNR